MKPQRLAFALSLTLAFPFMLHAEDIHVRVDPSPAAQPSLRQSLLDLDQQGHGPLDAVTLTKFKALIAQYGWPTVVAAGRDGVDAAGDLLERSSSDDPFQSAAKSAMASNIGIDINAQAFAVLYDHVELSHHRPQQFGSLLALENGKVITSPHTNSADVDIYRDSIGIPFLNTYLKQVQTAVDHGQSFAVASKTPRLSTPSHLPAQPAIRQQLRGMVIADQDARNAYIQAGMKDGSAEEKQMNAVDAANLPAMKAIIANYGFPDAAMVGRNGVSAAFLLVQHATTDTAFQAQALKLAEPALLKGDLPHQDYALLTDRVFLAQGKPQRYGSQVQMVNGHNTLLPLEDPAHVDQRRAAMGMPPLADYMKMLDKMYAPAPSSSSATKS